MNSECLQKKMESFRRTSYFLISIGWLALRVMRDVCTVGRFSLDKPFLFSSTDELSAEGQILSLYPPIHQITDLFTHPQTWFCSAEEPPVVLIQFYSGFYNIHQSTSGSEDYRLQTSNQNLVQAFLLLHQFKLDWFSLKMWSNLQQDKSKECRVFSVTTCWHGNV